MLVCVQATVQPAARGANSQAARKPPKRGPAELPMLDYSFARVLTLFWVIANHQDPAKCWDLDTATMVLELCKTRYLNSDLASTSPGCSDLNSRCPICPVSMFVHAPSSSLMAEESHLTLHKAKGIHKQFSQRIEYTVFKQLNAV